jgi:cell division protein FtsB
MTAGRPLRPGEKSRYPLREMSSRQRSRLEQRKVLFGLSLALAVVLVYSLVLSRNGVRRYAVLSTTLTERSDEAYQRIVRNRQLSEEIASLQNDDRALGPPAAPLTNSRWSRRSSDTCSKRRYAP